MPGSDDSDISVSQEQELEQDKIPQPNSHLGTSANYSNLDSEELLEGQLPFQLLDDPFHTYQNQKASPNMELYNYIEYRDMCCDQNNRSKHELNSMLSNFGESEECKLGRKVEQGEKGQESEDDEEAEEVEEAEDDEALKKQPKKYLEQGYEKNLIGYMAKRAIKLMFSKHSKHLSKKCRAMNVKYCQFKKLYKVTKDLKGPTSLLQLLSRTPQSSSEMKMKKLFQSTFDKIMRRDYMIYSLRYGKMKQLETYVRVKNFRLLYCADLVQML